VNKFSIKLLIFNRFRDSVYNSVFSHSTKCGVIFVNENENENGVKRENNKFVIEK